MFPFWIDFELTTYLQVLTFFGATAGWLLVTLTGRHCGA